jgi:non-specific serine/threonine protein kinase
VQSPVRRFNRSGHVDLDRPRHNLRQPLTCFIGRQREIAMAECILRSSRLLTLTGPGGVGKTRLGHEVAASLLDRSASEEYTFEDGAWIVELAAVADPIHVPQTVAAVLAVREHPKRPLTASLIDARRPKRLLLVLDNCEHLIEACATLAEALLGECPTLRILATSRQPLGLTGETTLPVPSLSLAPGVDGSRLATVDEGASRSVVRDRAATPEQAEPPAVPEAAQLFVERARAAMPAFTPSDGDLERVLQICRRLDGIPLAIELAAARVAVLSLEQIAARLDDRFRLLTGGSRTALPRYRTLQALIDWSHDLLDEQERVLLRRLSVFAGGWTLEAAEAACAGDGLASDEILDLLSGLVAQSLVQADERREEVRYRFLETIREYAVARLRAAGEETMLRDQHRAWLLALAERAEPELTGPRQRHGSTGSIASARTCGRPNGGPSRRTMPSRWSDSGRRCGGSGTSAPMPPTPAR